MKKSMIIFGCLAVLCLLSGIQLFSRGDIGPGVLALVFAGVFGYLAYSKAKKAKSGPSAATQVNTASVSGSSSAATPVAALPSIYGYQLKYDYDDVKIAGTTHYDTSAATVGEALDLVAEPDNEYDANAVAIMQHGIKLGHIYKGKLQDMYHDFTMRGDVVRAVLASKAGDALTMLLGFYVEQPTALEEFESKGYPSKSYRLTGNKNQEMQDTIGLLDVGEAVTVLYDVDKEKYSATAIDEIGYFPKSADEVLEGDCEAFVSSIDEDDNGKYNVTVTVFTL